MPAGWGRGDCIQFLMPRAGTAKQAQSPTRPRVTRQGGADCRCLVGHEAVSFRSRRWPLDLGYFPLLLLLAGSRAAAACIDPEGLAHSTVSITRYFSGDDGRGDPGLLGMRGTAWFLTGTSMVTAEHVAAAMALSDRSWKQIEIRERQNKQSIAVRILRVAGVHAEKLAVLELQTQFSGAQGLQIRMKPLAPEEQVVSLAYPSSRLRFAGGRFRTLWRQRKPRRHGSARDVRRRQSSRARSRCVRCSSAGLRGPRGRCRQQHLHANPAVSVPCDAGLHSLGSPNVVSVPSLVLAHSLPPTPRGHLPP